MTTLFTGPIDRSQEAVYRGLTQQRAFVARALAKTANELFYNYAPDPKMVLEVGAGDGFLKRTLSPKCDWIELDNYRATKRSDGGSFVIGNAANLPFKDSTFNVVVGFDSFNAFDFQDLRGSIAESVRVLRPGGTFLFFHDYQASNEIIMNLLGGNCLKKVTQITEKYLPKSKMEIVRPERAGEYNRLKARLKRSPKHDKNRIKLAEEEKKFWEPISNEDQLQMFHSYLTTLISNKFKNVSTGFAVNDMILEKQKGQKKINIHGLYFSEQAIKSTLKPDDVVAVQVSLLKMASKTAAREIVSLPFTVGKKKKS